MDNELISIIMPVYNCEKYLTQAINSVKKKIYKKWNLIIVNDKSTDYSYKIIKKSTKDIKDKVIIVNLKENEGVANARNVALNYVKGRYVAFLDSDDIWNERKLELQLNYMKIKNAIFTYTGYTRINEDGKILKYVAVPPKVGYKYLLKNTIMLTSTIMIDTKYIEIQSIKMPNLKRSEDTQTWLNILKNNIIADGINEDLAKYRQRKYSVSSNKFKSILGVWVVFRKYQSIGVLKSLFYIIAHSINALKKRSVIIK